MWGRSDLNDTLGLANITIWISKTTQYGKGYACVIRPTFTDTRVPETFTCNSTVLQAKYITGVTACRLVSCDHLCAAQCICVRRNALGRLHVCGRSTAVPYLGCARVMCTPTAMATGCVI